MNFLQLASIISDNESTLQFFQEQGILRRSLRCCNQNCSIVKSTKSDGKEFKCKDCKKTKTIRCDSFLEKSKLQLRVLLLAMYFFIHESPVRVTANMCKNLVSEKSILQWYVYLREIMSTYLLRTNYIFGTNGSIVQIDECCLGRKLKAGRGQVRGMGHVWVFGLIDVQTKKIHLQIVDKRDRLTLIPIIQNKCTPGDITHSNEAAVYSILPTLGFDHHTINHQETYVAPDGTHTNNIESVWACVETKMRSMRGTTKELVALHLDEFMYRWNRKTEVDKFSSFLDNIAEVYTF